MERVEAVANSPKIYILGSELPLAAASTHFSLEYLLGKVEQILHVVLVEGCEWRVFGTGTV
jgi:hypothetical protein